MKTCNLCEESKPESEYYKHKGRTTLYQTCKTCHKARTKEWHKANPGVRAEERWRRYGIVGMTWELYQQMLSEQDSGCAICQKPCGTGSSLAVDHDHKTGRVRGLLCASCNRFIGRIENGPVPLYRYIAYLTQPTSS